MQSCNEYLSSPHGERGPHAGCCQVILDDQQVATVDLSRAYWQKCLLFTSGVLPFGRHVLRIECLGRQGALSNDQILAIDGFLWLVIPDQPSHWGEL